MPSVEPQRRLWRRTGLVLFGTLISRIFGAVRDATIAALFLRDVTDIFVVAWTIPNALRALLAEGATSGAVIPVYQETRANDGESTAARYLGTVAGAMTLVLTLTSVAGVALAPLVVKLYALGYDDTRYELAVVLTRWTFPYVLLVGLSALAAGTLNAHGRFALPAMTPALLNLAFIGAALFLSGPLEAAGFPPVLALALGALTGGVLQVAVQLPLLRSLRALRWHWPRWRDPRLRQSARLFVPLLAGLGVYQANILLSRMFASFLEPGAQSYLFYSQRVTEIPQGMFAMSVSVVSLPMISAMVAKGAHQEVRETFQRTLRMTLLVAIPATVALMLLAQPTAAVYLGRGKFLAHDVEMTGHALTLMAAGIWAVATTRASIPMFHAFQDTRSPVLASGANLMVFSLVALGLLQQLGHLAIALALSCAAVAQLVVLFFLLRSRVGPLGLRTVAISAVRMGVATLPMAALVWFIQGFGHWSDGATWSNVGIYFGAVVGGIVAYLLLIPLFCPEDARDLLQALKRKKERRAPSKP